MRQIKAMREKIGLSQIELAQKVGVSQVSLCRYETGERNPPYKVLMRLAKVFGCSVDFLLEDFAS